MNIDVSVIVPIYNVENYIERCARSLMEQTLKNIEFIFVDDCSPDRSIDILKQVINEYPNRIPYIKIIYNTVNKGLATTRFIGIKEAYGTYVWNCDSDDWVELNMLETMYNKAKETDADIVCCEAVKESYQKKVFYKINYDEETLRNGLLALNLNEINVCIWNKLIRKSLFIDHKIKNYQGINMNEDSALTVRLRYFSKKTVVVHSPFYHYNRMNVNSMCASIKEEDIKQSMELALKIEKFFEEQKEMPRFKHVVNFYKFMSKQYILRNEKNYDKWRLIFPESHKDIFKFKTLTFTGRIKWWICAYMYYPSVWILKK